MTAIEKIDSLVQHFHRFEEMLDSIIKDVIAENEYVITNYNIYNQLYNLGINRLGVDIMSYAPYKPFTLKIKQENDQPTDRVTLRDTGDFHENFKIIFTEDSFEITSSDWKTESLKKKYGDEIFGLTEENLSLVMEDLIKPRLLFELKNIKQ